MRRICSGAVVLMISIIAASCDSGKNYYSGLMNPGVLADREYRIDNSRDTVLQTEKGAHITISKGSFSKNDVTLLIKEAYSPADIVRAGLTTVTNDGKLLTSGGMIRVVSKESGVDIVKPLGVSIPTHLYDPAMQLYKGSEDKGKVTWSDPDKLPLSEGAQRGKVLFEQHCAICHAMDQRLTGPPLRDFKNRGPWASQAEVFKFVRNPSAYMACNAYARELQQQYQAIMTAFPGLTPEAIDDITEYVQKDFVREPNLPAVAGLACYDSCSRYRELNALIAAKFSEKDVLFNAEGDDISRVSVDYNFADTVVASPPQRNFTPDTAPAVASVQKVAPENFKAQYYSFEIKTFGWYNIDHLVPLRSGEQSRLTAQIDQTPTKEYNVFLVVPQYNVFAEGGRIKGSDDSYGFYSEDGKIDLPQGTKCVVFAVSEKEGKILFGGEEFVSGAETNLRLTIKETDKVGFEQMVAALNLQKINIGVQETNLREKEWLQQNIDSLQRQADHLRPVHCDCGCAVGDTTAPVPGMPSGAIVRR